MSSRVALCAAAASAAASSCSRSVLRRSCTRPLASRICSGRATTAAACAGADVALSPASAANPAAPDSLCTTRSFRIAERALTLAGRACSTIRPAGRRPSSSAPLTISLGSPSLASIVGAVEDDRLRTERRPFSPLFLAMAVSSREAGGVEIMPSPSLPSGSGSSSSSGSGSGSGSGTFDRVAAAVAAIAAACDAACIALSPSSSCSRLLRRLRALKSRPR